ncbi:MAG: hypothetical protein HYW89_02875 [Candidatus Sungiibacteriota bacterium]|uniref:Nuclear transport factor 2 family protein n=1 Tax=Candidatus Sungiibacteriota bacterium TaxID=2750080 RepID=A0A7T5URS6_9BACT|nr:MAG: hypothetical protein HYW89_02875 [Candidatus Sungbacteria bacterium]
MRKLLSIFLAVALFAAPSLGEARSLELRAYEFYENVVNGDYDDVWDMLTTAIQQDISQEDFIRELEAFFEETDFNYDNLEIVEQRGNYAVTEAIVTLSSEKFYKSFCEKTLWVRRGNSWYVADANLRCDYDPLAGR